MYDSNTNTPHSLNVRMLQAKVIETRLYGCVTWILSAILAAKLRSAHRQAPCESSASHHATLSNALKKTRCDSIEWTLRTYVNGGSLLLAGVARIRQSSSGIPPGDVGDILPWGAPETGRTIEPLAEMPTTGVGRRLGVSSHRGVHGALSVGGLSRDRNVVYCRAGSSIQQN